MLKELKIEANRTLTENGAVTLRTTGSDCLDLFAAIGALRRQKQLHPAKQSQRRLNQRLRKRRQRKQRLPIRMTFQTTIR